MKVIKIDKNYNKIFADDREIKLRPTEYNLLFYISKNQRLVSMKEIKVALYDEIQSDNSIVQTISSINKKLPHRVIINTPHKRILFVRKCRGTRNMTKEEYKLVMCGLCENYSICKYKTIKLDTIGTCHNTYCPNYKKDVGKNDMLSLNFSLAFHEKGERYEK